MGYIGALVRDRAVVDDLLQSVALTAVEKMDEYDESRSFDAWVIGIARFKVLQYYRQTTQDRLVFDEDLAEAFTRHYARKAGGYEDRLSALRACMQKLPADASQLLVSRYFDEQSVHSIAGRMGKTPARISKQLFSIRRALERCIAEVLGREGGRSDAMG